MARKAVELSTVFPYHLSARSNDGAWCGVPLRRVYEIYATRMQESYERYGLECHAFVLMPNHIHMLVSTPRGNLSAAMRYFMTETSRAIARSAHRVSRVYGSRYRWSILREPESFAHALYYVYRLPVLHELAWNVEAYPWSTLYPKESHFSNLRLPAHGFDRFIPTSRSELIGWIQEEKSDRYIECLRKALRRSEFCFALDRSNKKRPNFRHELAHPEGA